MTVALVLLGVCWVAFFARYFMFQRAMRTRPVVYHRDTDLRVAESLALADRP